MRPKMGFMVVTLVGIACSEIKVQPPPGLDMGQDVVTTDPPERGWSQVPARRHRT